MKNLNLPKVIVSIQLIVILGYFTISNISIQENEFMSHLWHRMLNLRRTSIKFQIHQSPRDVVNKTRLEMCPNVVVSNRFAFVTYIGMNSLIQSKVNWYIVSACKLAQSILSLSSGSDLIMMLAQDNGFSLDNYHKDMIEWSGWQICNVESLSSKHKVNNRFHDARIYTKLHIWKMIEYEAVVCVDSDMFAVRDASDLFQSVWPEMKSQNFTFAMGLDYPRLDSKRSLFHILIGKCLPSWSEYNGGLFLLKPSIETYHALIEMMDDNSYDINMCEQGLLNAYFMNKTFTLPFKYNVNLVTKVCDPQFYLLERDSAVFLHFTVAKPWMTSLWVGEYMWTCPWWNLDLECSIWNQF